MPAKLPAENISSNRIEQTDGHMRTQPDRPGHRPPRVNQERRVRGQVRDDSSSRACNHSRRDSGRTPSAFAVASTAPARARDTGHRCAAHVPIEPRARSRRAHGRRREDEGDIATLIGVADAHGHTWVGRDGTVEPPPTPFIFLPLRCGGCW